MVRVVVQGEVHVDEAIATMRNVVADPDFEPSFDAVADLTRMQHVPDFSRWSRVAGSMQSLGRSFQGNVTLVVSRRDLTVARLFSALVGASGLKITVEVQRPGGTPEENGGEAR
jgi:hypothetical protein